jgi:hypothetical protein
MTRTGLLPCLLLLPATACRSVRPPEASAPASAAVASAAAIDPTGADFLSIARPGSGSEARWTEVTARADTGGFRTDFSAKPTSPAEGEELVEAHFTIIRLNGPGDYPLGFGWDRGQSRVTLQARDGTRCMTPRKDAGLIEITAAPSGRALAPGDRLEGRFRVHCFPEGDDTSGKEPRVFTGAFAATVGPGK